MCRSSLCKPKLVFLLAAVLIFCGTVFLPATAQGTADIHPILIIERVNAERAVAGELFYLTVVLNNMGDYPAFNVFAELDSPKFQGEEVFTIETTATQEDPHLAKIDAGETRSFSFPVKVNAKAQNVDYSLRISLKSQDAYFNPATPRSSTNTTIKVNYEISSPNLTVDNVILEPAKPQGTEPFTAVFYLDNYSGAEAHNVFVEIDGNDNFRVLDTTASKFLPSVARNSLNFVSFKLHGLENRSTNSVKLTFKYEHQGAAVESSPLVVNLPLEKAAPGTAPRLTVKSFSLAKTARDDEYRLRLTLENLGEQEAADIRLTFDGGGKIYVLQGSNIDHLPSIEGKSSSELVYLLGINRAAGDTHLPLTVKLEYKDSIGNNLDALSETLGISAADLGSSRTGQGKPRVLISKYTLSAEKILAGNVVTLNLFIDNTHTLPVQNIKVSLGVAQVEGTTTGTAGGSAGTVFSPVNSSNSFFVERIPARTTLERSVDLLVDPNTTAKTYTVPVTIEYEDGDAESYRVEEMVNIPVTQESRMQIISVEVPPVAFAGQPAFVSAEFVNVGKVDLGNFMVMLEGNFHKEQAAYFVGNLQIGASDFYQGIIYPDQEGPLQGELIFSYLDNNNQEVRVAEPFRMEVQSAEMREPFPGGEMPPYMQEPQAPSGGILRWLLYIVPLLVIAVAVILVRRRRARKSEEEFLDA